MKRFNNLLNLYISPIDGASGCAFGGGTLWALPEGQRSIRQADWPVPLP